VVERKVVYQVFLLSFKDRAGDGIGALRGIMQQRDDLQAFGVDVVWLSPVYTSPNDDMGSDMRDDQDSMDEFGARAHWDAMLDGMHARGIRLVMALVVNHAPDETPWFVERRTSKENAHRDHSIWRPGREDREPHN